MDERQQHAKWKEPDAKDHILYNYIDVKCPEEANQEIESGLVTSWNWGWLWRLSTNGYEGSLWGDGIILKLDCSDGCTIV